ncbi:MAG: peptidoglycan-binding protein, partial [Nitrospira sp.]|nr:peptidoglycan-binding protein [Nitrospira sp.]
MVADYNSRCGSFRYRSGALESARRDVEPYRSQLQAEGRGRFARGPSTGSLSAPAPARPAADETVRAVQQKLNELGYSAGPADGLMGRGTRAAIIAFQQDRGLAATGVADQTLLFQLRQVPSGSARGSGANAPAVQDAPSRSSPSATAPLFVPPTPSVQRSGPPANSWVSGSNWYCKEGFRKVDNECVALVVPQNAFVSGSNWYCKEGFRKVGNQCEALVVPPNAFVSGSNW